MFPVVLATQKGGLNSKLHTVYDVTGKPICLLLSEGWMSDYKGAALLLPVLPDTQELIADWFRQAAYQEDQGLSSSKKG